MSNVKSAQVVNLGESGSWRVGNSHREFFSGIYPGTEWSCEGGSAIDFPFFSPSLSLWSVESGVKFMHDTVNLRVLCQAE